MAVFNFDLQDGKPPVSFSLGRDDTDRLIDFMSKCHAYRASLEEAHAKAAVIAAKFTRNEDASDIDELVELLAEAKQ